MRRFEMVLCRTREELTAAFEAFRRGGFFDEQPEWCVMRSGAFLLRDQEGGYKVLVCGNGNWTALWQ